MNKTLIALCLALTTTSISAMAADAGSGKITFKGTVNSGACTIAPSDVNKEVQLGNISAANLATAGKTGPLNTFELKLQDCQLDPSASGTPYSKVKIAFNGQPDSAKAALWANTGSADNVAVAFFNNAGNPIKPGDVLEQTLKASETTIILSAQVESTGAASSGSVNSVANYVLSYE
ncbi:fimbrial protein [Providencia vermicola]|uniref:fimbrial protein n=1 Tax=Providencia vermicola TaxID=333965 RepID=UPI001CECD791|nr:fimbrial protein [Providencia vermicola]USR65144.1 type 1 fimbrial protein [Providencia stuartii]